MNEKRIVHEFSQIIDDDMFSTARTFDNKSLFINNFNKNLLGFDISTRKQVSNNIGIHGGLCVVTYDNKFLITDDNECYCKFTKWSIRTKKRLYT